MKFLIFINKNNPERIENGIFKNDFGVCAFIVACFLRHSAGDTSLAPLTRIDLLRLGTDTTIFSMLHARFYPFGSRCVRGMADRILFIWCWSCYSAYIQAAYPSASFALPCEVPNVALGVHWPSHCLSRYANKHASEYSCNEHLKRSRWAKHKR